MRPNGPCSILDQKLQFKKKVLRRKSAWRPGINKKKLRVLISKSRKKVDTIKLWSVLCLINPFEGHSCDRLDLWGKTFRFSSLPGSRLRNPGQNPVEYLKQFLKYFKYSNYFKEGFRICSCTK